MSLFSTFKYITRSKISDHTEGLYSNFALSIVFYKNYSIWYRKTDHQLEALDALLKDPDLVPKNHIVVHNYLYIQCQGIQLPSVASMCTRHILC